MSVHLLLLLLSSHSTEQPDAQPRQPLRLERGGCMCERQRDRERGGNNEEKIGKERRERDSLDRQDPSFQLKQEITPDPSLP